jgi:tRNA A37 threonylcarbamoyladenosine modification protein TsaB
VALSAGPSKATVALLPAGRGELFAQLFSVESNDVRSIDHASHLKPEDVWNKYASLRTLTWAGPGAHAHAPALKQRAQAEGIAFLDQAESVLANERDRWILAGPCENLAASVAAIALSEFQRGNTVRPEDLRAIYVRPSDAEINQKWPNEKLLSM